METYSVSQITKKISGLISADATLSGVAIEGEVSNCTLHSSGHLYFSLKDENAKINCIMFARDVRNIDFLPEAGMHIIAYGRVMLYEKTSTCQLQATVLIHSGMGVLHEKYSRLLKELESQGYFDKENKKPLPTFIKKAAVITSPTGAVIHDIINTVRRRNPTVQIILCPAPVQGSGAAKELAERVSRINRLNLADVIIVARGGGSLEELWAFNEQELALAIYASKIPVISAVGHETDFTISDFVADVRAATPTAAAEMVSFPRENYLAHLSAQRLRMVQVISVRLEDYRQRLKALSRPAALTQMLQNNITGHRNAVKTLLKTLAKTAETMLVMQRMQLANLQIRLEANDVAATLAKGYALVKIQDKLLTGKEQARLHESIDVIFDDFRLKAEIVEIKGETYGAKENI
ncbi:MAG: exodeoxyribonuclease VII large subunit [Eubacteriales bacterium]|jgi:exodeoxyribonuclease VII large subunit